MNIKKVANMRNFRLLLTTIVIGTIVLSGCIPAQPVKTTIYIPTATKQLKGLCPNRSNKDTPFQSSATKTPSLSILRSEIENYLNSGQDVSGLKPLILDIQGNTVGSIV